jgi:hypothetical protein
MDDISLVGLAARVRDPVVLAAARESCVAYAEVMVTGIPPQRQYVWQVDDDLADMASRFIEAFQTLFHEELPPPVPVQADRYWDAYRSNEIMGRCVRIGYDDRVSPVRQYHWGICMCGRLRHIVVALVRVVAVQISAKKPERMSSFKQGGPPFAELGSLCQR